ncbi:hypothetical protein HO133_008198 [Letharia lupina]|uniref:S-adenosyl-L-methionine-dependent methyltransferase n=1 Tax=Letharia lupina TaxID=560253 RepID=A0A8H6FHU7_9LECA|nr:uncharacterized protein HO133_008198 [Letharia lupina]KAF6228468.1 hypothetical protein HO133_008198 [Letharia lupina]
MDVSADHTVDRDTPSFSSVSSHARSGAATARTYYDSHDADTFYRTIWGGSTINIGPYDSPNDPIPAASHRTIERMAALLAPITRATRILDLGSGYGGAARYLARTYGCNVCCVNVSEVENERSREMVEEEGLGRLVGVREGCFEDLGSILKRLKLQSLGDVESYRRWFEEAGFVDVGFVDLTRDMEVHYGRVLREMESRERELKGDISDDYVGNMKVGLRNWVEGARSGRLCWGILQFHR